MQQSDIVKNMVEKTGFSEELVSFFIKTNFTNIRYYITHPDEGAAAISFGPLKFLIPEWKLQTKIDDRRKKTLTTDVLEKVKANLENYYIKQQKKKEKNEQKNKRRKNNERHNEG